MAASSSDVKSIFGAAVDLSSPEERAAYLQEACANNSELRAEVEALLWAHHDVGSFLKERDLPPTKAESAGEVPGTVIGSYKLLQQIGEGGMGTVFMAEQSQPVQRMVALKIIRPGMDSR